MKSPQSMLTEVKPPPKSLQVPAAEPDPQQELTWRGALKYLWPSRWTLTLCVLVFAALSTWFAFYLPNEYTADTIVVPVERMNESESGELGALAGLATAAGITLGENTSKQVAISTLDSRFLIESLIRDEDLLPLLFWKRWDPQTHGWKHSFIQRLLHPRDPTLLDGYTYLIKNVVTVKEDKVRGFVLLKVEWTSKPLAERWATELVRRTNESLRQRDLDISEHRLAFLNEQVNKTTDVALKNAIYILIQHELKQQTVLRGDEQYAFKTIDPPVLPEKKSSPNRWLISLGGTFLGLLLTIAGIAARRKLPPLFAGLRQELSDQAR